MCSSSVRCPRVAFFYVATLKKATCLLFEYMELGSLKDVMRDASFGLDWSRALDVAVDAARAINALHHWDPVILHGNLKSSNVLVWRGFGGLCMATVDYCIGHVCDACM